MTENPAIAELRNLGPSSARRLRVVGIRTLEDLKACGAVDAFCRIRDAGFRPSLNLLWALQGALADLPWTELPDDLKSSLRREVERRMEDS